MWRRFWLQELETKGAHTALGVLRASAVARGFQSAYEQKAQSVGTAHKHVEARGDRALLVCASEMRFMLILQDHSQTKDGFCCS